MNDDIHRLEEWVAPLLQKLSAAERRKLTRAVALDLRRNQQRRMQAQRNPDGSRWAPRSEKSEPPVINKPVAFIYRKPGDSRGRKVLMVSYQQQGDRLTGFDREAGGMRTFLKSRIEKWLPTPSGGGGGRLRRKAGGIRRRAMFSKMRNARNLRLESNATHLAVAFTGRVGRIARVHQFGLRDRVTRNGPIHQYEERRLLGFNPENVQRLQDSIIDHLSSM